MSFLLAPNAIRTQASAPIVISAGKPIVIAVSVPLTGADAPRGIENRDAVIAALERWQATNGAKLKGHAIAIRTEDDGCTESEAATAAAQSLTRQEGLTGVIGPECSAGVVAALPVYANAGIVALSGAATRSDLTNSQPPGNFFFRTAYSNEAEGTHAAGFISGTLKARTVSLIDDGESYGEDLAQAFGAALQQQGVTVTRASVQRGALDFSQLASAVVSANPDFVGFTGFNPEAALLYRQLRDAGYKGPFGSGDGAASPAAFITPLGAKAAEGVYMMGCSPALPGQFRQDFRKVHGSEPSASAFTGHFADATRILLDAVAAVAVDQDGVLQIEPIKLRDAVRATRLSDGVSGHIAFDGKGDRMSTASDVNEQARDLGLTGCQVQNGRFVILFPA